MATRSARLDSPLCTPRPSEGEAPAAITIRLSSLAAREAVASRARSRGWSVAEYVRRAVGDYEPAGPTLPQDALGVGR